MKYTEQVRNVDDEWVALMAEAKAIGLTIDEIRMFLTESRKN